MENELDIGHVTPESGLTINSNEAPESGDIVLCKAGFESERQQFVSGYVDRFVHSRSFVPHICSYWKITGSEKYKLAYMLKRSGVKFSKAWKWLENVEQEQKNFIADLKSKLGEADSMPGHEIREHLVEALRKKVNTVEPEPLGNKEVPKHKLHVSSHRLSTDQNFLLLNPLPKGVSLTSLQAQKFLGQQGKLAILTTPNHLPMAISQETLHKEFVKLEWLGILFLDRLRLRPTGIVAGEFVYSLSLAPGEEVLTREQEAELEFSSTWSTDVTQSTTDSYSHTNASQMGFNVGAQIYVVNVGANVGMSTSSTHTISSQDQVSRGTEVSRRAAYRMRSEHKTTFKVGTDVVEEFGSRRILSNQNPSRALTLKFYKLYEKQRILLERYDARMCVLLHIKDPGKYARQELIEELSKLDPNYVLSLDRCPDVASSQTVTNTQSLYNMDLGSWGTEYSIAKSFTAAVPPGMALSNFRAQVTRWVVVDGDDTYDAEPSEFEAYGGVIYATFVVGSGFGQSSGVVQIQIEARMPEASGRGWLTESVDVRATFTFTPSTEFEEQRRNCIEQEQQRIRESFSMDKVKSIVEEVSNAETALIHRQIFEQVLLPRINELDYSESHLDRLHAIYEWEEMYVEYMPWWMHASGRQARQRLRDLLLNLPGDTRSDLVLHDFLLSSYAKVYLPITPGRELSAINVVLKDEIPDELEECIREFRIWRNVQFAKIPQPIPTSDSVEEIGPDMATKAGSDDWANDWERPRRKFLVLDEWSETIPTDGVHIEPSVSECITTDEQRARALEADLQASSASNERDLARAELERNIGDNVSENIVIHLGEE
jgi:hypothetical protein